MVGEQSGGVPPGVWIYLRGDKRLKVYASNSVYAINPS